MCIRDSFDRPDVRQEYHYNLILFKEIKRFIIYRDQLGMKAVFLNIVGNVAGFMPFGFFLPIISRRSRKWYNTVLFGFSFSLAIEITQLVWKVGSFDVEDVYKRQEAESPVPSTGRWRPGWEPMPPS